jgi:hypothetical protein
MAKKPAAKKKSTKVSFNSSKKKRILLIAIIVVLVLAGVAFWGKSSAYSSTIKICNSSESKAMITAYSIVTGSKSHLRPGDCSGTWNHSSDVRVDVDSYGDSGILSYKLGVIGEGYGSCHEYSFNSRSNPPDEAAVRYRNYFDGVCKW